VATFADGHALMDSINSINPHVIVVDSAIPLLNGLEAGRQLKEKITGIRFVFLTMNEAPEFAVEAVKLAATWVRFEGICALRGASSYSGRASRQILRHTTDCQGDAGILHSRSKRHRKSLTPRWGEVSKLFGEGKSMKEAVLLLYVRRGRLSHLPRPLALAHHGTVSSQLRYLANREASIRIVIAVSDRPQKSAPSSPMSGKLLAVVGSFLGAASPVVGDFFGAASAVSTGGVGWAATMRIGTPCVGTCGFGGALPVLSTSCATTVSGTSVIL
jgi:CheY-like chemotaxis protein